MIGCNPIQLHTTFKIDMNEFLNQRMRLNQNFVNNRLEHHIHNDPVFLHDIIRNAEIKSEEDYASDAMRISASIYLVPIKDMINYRESNRVEYYNGDPVINRKGYRAW